MHITDNDYRRLKQFMKDNYGINLENKASLIEGRLGNIIARRGYEKFSDYVDYILSNPTADEISILISRLTTNYTYFLREEIHYNFLRDVVLPDLAKRIKDKDLRIWSAGCSSGEEAYTAAMLLNEYFKAQGDWDTTVLATDISANVLNIARKGVYEADKLKQLPAEWRHQYFVRIDEHTYRVSDALRKKVVFGDFNLMDKVLPFKKKFHVIFCRNVMIYFDAKTREELCGRFYDALDKGGYLFIGLSETMTNIKSSFKYVRPAIYRKEQ